MLFKLQRAAFPRRLILVCAVIAFYGHTAVSPVAERLGTYQSIEPYTVGRATVFAVAELLKKLRATCRWDSASGCLQCVLQRDTVLMHEGVPFMYVNGTLRQLVWPPTLAQGRLALPAAGLAQFLRSIGIDSFAINIAGDSFAVASPGLPLEAARTIDAESKTPWADRGAEAKPRVAPSASNAVGGAAGGPEISRRSAITTIVIDAGHGGKDPGAIGQAGTREKDVTLAVALKIRDLLKQKTDVKVYLTRDRDVYIPLHDRTKFANQKKADLFVSIHANAVPGPKKRMQETKGYKVYFLSQAKNEDDRLAAMRENAVVAMEEETAKHGYLQHILADLIVNEYLAESQEVSILIAEEFNSSLSKVSRLHQGVGQANFWVLNGAHMPAVLIEMCFISHPEEEKLLSDAAFQSEIAEAIVAAILRFRERYAAR